MKKVVSIGLILVLSIQCFYKLGIIGYFQLNKEYIAQVLCVNKKKPASTCQGQCFLKRNLQLSEESQELPSAPVGKEKIDLPSFIVSEWNHKMNVQVIPQVMNTIYFVIYSYMWIASPFHPPSALAS